MNDLSKIRLSKKPLSRRDPPPFPPESCVFLRLTEVCSWRNRGIQSRRNPALKTTRRWQRLLNRTTVLKIARRRRRPRRETFSSVTLMKLVLQLSLEVRRQLMLNLLITVVLHIRTTVVVSEVEVEWLRRLRMRLDRYDYRAVALECLFGAGRLPLAPAADYRRARYKGRSLGHAAIECMQIAYETRNVKQIINERNKHKIKNTAIKKQNLRLS